MARPLDGSSKLPLRLRRHVGDAPGQHLTLLIHKAKQELRVFIVDVLTINFGHGPGSEWVSRNGFSTDKISWRALIRLLLLQAPQASQQVLSVRRAGLHSDGSSWHRDGESGSA